MITFRELKQKRWWIRKQITLLPDGVHYFSRDHENETELKIEYQQILSRKKSFIRTERYPKILTATYFVVAVGILRSAILYPSNLDFFLGSLLSLGLGLLGFGVYRLVKTDYFCLLLEDNTALFLLRNSPDQKEVKAFADALFHARKGFLRKEYFFIDYEGNRKMELDRMKWLFSEDVISENEYLVVVDEINENLGD